MSKNVLFRADSSSTIGTGHIMRDLVLAKRDFKNDNVIFATRDLEDNINHKIKEVGYKVEILETNDIEELEKMIKKYNIDMVVIDHYGLDHHFEKQLKIQNTKLKIMVLDDTYEKHYCDILLNHNISADKNRYKGLVPKQCKLLCGSRYTLLRKEFYEAKKRYKKLKTQNSKLKILIMMGGSDSQNLTPKILNVLENFNDIEIDVVTTTANSHLKELREYITDKQNITLHIDTQEVAKLMALSDLAVLTPSVTVNEAYFMELPFIAIKTETNQYEMYIYLQKKNFMVLERFDEHNFRKTLSLMINEQKTWLIDFSELTLEEKLMVLEWRNSDFIKKWMFHRDNISVEEHLAYIDLLKKRDDAVYFLVKDDMTYIGVVSLTNICPKKSAELGIYTNPNLKGYGILLMRKIIDYAFNGLRLKQIYANVYKTNTKAINLYKKFHFESIETFSDFYGDIIKMELKNENSKL